MPNESTDIHYWSIAQLADRLRTGDISSVEITRHVLERIERLNTRLHCYVTVLHEEALDQARRADEERALGVDHGPLHGVPFAIKDNIYTANAPTTVGSTFLAEYTPRWDATVVRHLRNAGAVLLGKLAMTEGAISEYPPNRAAPVNPWHADYWTGLSSSGSGVAVAAGLCFAALGTDTGGSIRMPSASCGVSGLKATWGRVSVRGVFPFCATRDHVGPMARNVRDVAFMLSVIAGHDHEDPASLADPLENYVSATRAEIDGLRLGVDWCTLIDGVDPEVATALKDAVHLLQSLGASVHEVAYPSPEDYLACNFAEAAAEVAMVHRDIFAARRNDYGSALRSVVEAGALVTSADLVRVEQEEGRLVRALSRVFADIDVLVLPVFSVRTQTITRMADELNDPSAFVRLRGRYTLPFNASGNPTLTIPCGVDCNGLPIAVQLVGRHLDEASLLRVGAAFQRSTDWHARHPNEIAAIAPSEDIHRQESADPDARVVRWAL